MGFTHYFGSNSGGALGADLVSVSRIAELLGLRKALGVGCRVVSVAGVESFENGDIDCGKIENLENLRQLLGGIAVF